MRIHAFLFQMISEREPFGYVSEVPKEMLQQSLEWLGELVGFRRIYTLA